MNCQQAENYIYEYCDANLSPELCLQLEEHLKACENCRRLLELTKMENTVLKDALALDYLDENFTRRVMNAVSARSMASTLEDKPHKNSRGKKPYWYLASAAAIVLLFTAFAPGIYNDLFYQNSQMDVAIKDTSKNQQKVDKAMEIARNEKVMAEKREAEKDAVQESGNGTDAGSYVAGYGSAADESENYNSTASTENNAPVQIAMTAEAPAVEILQDTTGITRSVPSVSPKTASPNRYRSYAINVAGSTEDYYSMPVNLPDNYVLEKSLNSESAVIYLYSETNSDQAVEITIEPYSTASSTDILTLADNDVQSAEDQAAKTLTQHIEVIAEYENAKYLIKLKSSLTTEELLKLAKAIQLGEK